MMLAVGAKPDWNTGHNKYQAVCYLDQNKYLECCYRNPVIQNNKETNNIRD